eukprot:TRINITY_DN2605_c0_g1_i3.p1 TRINITY_DN2605_c0_g1~~TRINITY_DN2605_c0_g1_i3.p1  ORF type:complete len:555 (+),score=139.63 TRINITY_DN2605_c0_g1_i3:346-2010(+)
MYKSAINAMSPGQSAFFLPVSAILIYGLLRLCTQAFADLRDTVFMGVANHAIRKAALETFAHLHALSLRYHLERKTGGILRAVDRGTKAISFVLTFLLFNIGPTLLEVLIVVGIMFASYEAYFAVITFCTVVGYVVFTLVVTEWRTKFRRMMNEMDSESSDKAVDSLINFETVKYFSNEAHEINRYDAAVQAYMKAGIKSQGSLALLNIGQALIIAAGSTSCMILAALRVVTFNGMTIGDFVAINLYIMQLYTPLNFLGTSWRIIKQSITDLEAMFKLQREKLEIEDAPEAKDLDTHDSAEIRFEHVKFQYNDDDRMILNDVSFTVPAGHKVAIVGPSGAGKTSIARLLYRLYDKQEGRILIDGQEIASVTQASLRRAIGIVPQDTVLFNDTIQYNIGYGRIGSTLDEIRGAARLAQIDDFIMGLKDGYATKVGERGLRLSGGEKQRVAIARAILKNPAVMIFDEATSALDSRTEQEIQTALREVSRGRTTVVVAHRLSTIIDSDQIMVLRGGDFAERGTHAELLEKRGEYYGMWMKQQEQLPVGDTATAQKAE